MRGGESFFAERDFLETEEADVIRKGKKKALINPNREMMLDNPGGKKYARKNDNCQKNN
jgi:hypothetical protein